METLGIQLAAWQGLNMDSVKKNMITKSTVNVPPAPYPASCFLALLNWLLLLETLKLMPKSERTTDRTNPHTKKLSKG